jgi:hypothetical protein
MTSVGSAPGDERRAAGPPVGARYPLTPHPARLDPARPDYDEIRARHRRSVAARADTYRDPATGFFVFTAAYLWARGHCCDNECRHCPYLDRESRLLAEAAEVDP